MEHVQQNHSGDWFSAFISGLFALLGTVTMVETLQIIAYSVSILVGLGTLFNMARKWRNERRTKRK